MSDQPDRSEKQFDASPRRLQKAREEGNVFRSKELQSVGVLMAGGAVLLGGAPYAFAVMQRLTARLFLGAPTARFDPHSLQLLFFDVGLQGGLILLPLFAALTVAGVGLSVAQTGWHPSAKPLQPKGNRISPLQGLKRLFSSKGLFETGKALVKVAVVGPLAYVAIAERLPEVLTLHMLPLDAVYRTAGGWVSALLVQIVLALAVLSVADFAYERWKWKSDLKMTRKEVRDEAKDQEGDPHVKGKRRQIARERAQRPRLDHAVLQADVVVTNPTHYAIALRYAPEEGGAPRVLAKGVRKRALRMKALAAEHAVPTVEDRPLARALYAAVPEGQEIPEDLYAAVATILAEVYRQRDGQPAGRSGGPAGGPPGGSRA
ncbi:MAG: EscU/YscU/HrcU family type III secretion system export apparatus switch protein [Rhodothermales bacterium]|nr:EscU/YscU/HrcU family type III secretion system export apparatus switch protein [Rhodothermales bacterium]